MKTKPFRQNYKNLGGGQNQALPPTDIQDYQCAQCLNMSFNKVIATISKRYGNHVLGNTTIGAGKTYGLFEHNDHDGVYTKFRVVDGGDLEKLTGSTWAVTDVAEFTTQLDTDAVNFSVGGTPRIYIVNGTDTVRYTDETGICSVLGTITGKSGQRIVEAQGRMFQGVFTDAAKSDRFEWTKTFSDQFYKDGESYATSTNYELLPEPITALEVLIGTPIIFSRNSVYVWDIVSSSKAKISDNGTASQWGVGVIPESNMLIYAGLNNLYTYRQGQRNTTPIGNRLISGTGIAVYELISAASRSDIKIGTEGYKAYIAIGDITIPDYDTDGDFVVSDACIEYDSQTDVFSLHDNFHVNVFRRLTDTTKAQLYYGSEDSKATFGVEDGADFSDHDDAGADIGIDGRFRMHSNEVKNPSVGKLFKALRLRIRNQTISGKYLDVWWVRDDSPAELICDDTDITNVQRVALPTEAGKKWNDVWLDLPPNKSRFSVGFEFRNNDVATNMPIQEVMIEGSYTDDLYKHLSNG